jgi:predicted molibdopterin-dependent oxidoreductase YjgC
MADEATETKTTGHGHHRRPRRRGAAGELLIAAAERAGTYIPRFCYHPRMEPVGMCRMCIVEVDTGRGPRSSRRA